MTPENWLKLLKDADIADIPSILDAAPEAIQNYRGAWECADFSLQIQCVAAISFLEGFLAGHPTLLSKG